MNRILRIKAGEISNVSKRDLKKAVKILLITMTVYIPLQIFTLKGGTNTLLIVAISSIFTVLISSGILRFMYGFKKLYYQSLIIKVNTEGVSKIIDTTTPPSLSGILKINWEQVKNISQKHSISINWEDIKLIKENKYGLLIKGKQSNSFSGNGQFQIPKEIEEFNELKAFLFKVHQDKKEAVHID
ncbi:hypothetical protein [Flammeovirga sp. SubArs3]|uniref:hypothetical protein n=1 Tax=Flammeovirga sp. SubArs3 TaxID=2995316 RepID=UPI00248BA97E|nr:hypothetical protein [Flammeovirga sp. SubArs3]